ncbi:unnamed protein product [Caretta caretta]
MVTILGSAIVLIWLFSSSMEDASPDGKPKWIGAPSRWLLWGGGVSTLSCAFTTKYQTFHWYQPLPGRGLTYPLAVSPQDNATEQRFVGQPLEDGKRSPLHITDSQVGDSGSYLCAVRAE